MSSQYNKNEVRVTHMPSGATVTTSLYRTMHRNKDLAIRVIKARLSADAAGWRRPAINETTAGTRCPICEQGFLSEHVEMLSKEVYGEMFEIPSLYCICSYCGSEQADGEQVNKNAEFMRKAAQFSLLIREEKASKSTRYQTGVDQYAYIEV